MKTCCVFSAEWTEYLNVIYARFGFRKLIFNSAQGLGLANRETLPDLDASKQASLKRQTAVLTALAPSTRTGSICVVDQKRTL
jgi:hypothetical protein